MKVSTENFVRAPTTFTSTTRLAARTPSTHRGTLQVWSLLCIRASKNTLKDRTAGGYHTDPDFLNTSGAFGLLCFCNLPWVHAKVVCRYYRVGTSCGTERNEYNIILLVLMPFGFGNFSCCLRASVLLHYHFTIMPLRWYPVLTSVMCSLDAALDFGITFRCPHVRACLMYVWPCIVGVVYTSNFHNYAEQKLATL